MTGSAKFVTACAICPVVSPSSPEMSLLLSGGRIVVLARNVFGRTKAKTVASIVTVIVNTAIKRRFFTKIARTCNITLVYVHFHQLSISEPKNAVNAKLPMIGKAAEVLIPRVSLLSPIQSSISDDSISDSRS